MATVRPNAISKNNLQPNTWTLDFPISGNPHLHCTPSHTHLFLTYSPRFLLPLFTFPILSTSSHWFHLPLIYLQPEPSHPSFILLSPGNLSHSLCRVSAPNIDMHLLLPELLPDLQSSSRLLLFCCSPDICLHLSSSLYPTISCVLTPNIMSHKL